ncbi:MAG: glycosyltransferase family 2 protein [bacterium]|nr:glycosyltransferase family 2 protein [bacterium]
MFISIIIPAYNEATRIRKTLDRYVPSLYPGKVEYLVVLNGCTDNTSEVVKKARTELGESIHIHELEMGGKGLAIRHGFKEARGELVGFLDADGATAPEEYEKLIQALIHGRRDGAIASRWKKGSKVIARTSFFRTIASQGFHIIMKLLFWMPFRDTQCGAKIFRRHVIEKILPQLRVKNMTIDVEILYACKMAGYDIEEVPTVWIDQTNSEQFASLGKLIKTSWNMFIALIAIRFHHSQSRHVSR